jgi:DNA-binding MarR family transcriptional regulator
LLGRQSEAVLELYPKIFFACHTRHVRDPATSKTVSARQVQLLDHLDRVEPTLVSELAGHLGVTASTVSITVDRLERGGYVTRRRDPRDGRRVALRLTAAGDRIRQASSVLDPERVVVMLGRLTVAQRREAIAGLALLAGAAMEGRTASSGAPFGSAGAQRSKKGAA